MRSTSDSYTGNVLLISSEKGPATDFFLMMATANDNVVRASLGYSVQISALR